MPGIDFRPARPQQTAPSGFAPRAKPKPAPKLSYYTPWYKSNSKVLVGGAATGLLVLCALAYFFIFRGGSRTEVAAQQPPVVSGNASVTTSVTTSAASPEASQPSFAKGPPTPLPQAVPEAAPQQPSPVNNKYANVPQSARNVYAVLKKLDVKIEMGINYESYKTEVENIYPDIRLFLESADGKVYPELCFLLSNIGDCYLLVREKWHDSIYQDYGFQKLSAGNFVDFGRPRLWKIASLNIAGINVLLNDTPEQASAFLQRLPQEECNYTLLSACLLAAQDFRANGGRIGYFGFLPSDFEGLSGRLEAQARMGPEAAKKLQQLNAILSANLESQRKKEAK